MTEHETIIRTYASTTAYTRDHSRLSLEGWSVTSTTTLAPRAGIARIATIGLFALVFPPKPKIVVTYQRIKRPGQAPIEQPRTSVLVNDWLHTTCGWPWWLVKVTSVLVVVNDWLRKRLGL